jgi:adenylate kinase family enzyme
LRDFVEEVACLGGAAMRVVVVGTSGSGKTTFAGRLAAATGIPHLELDQVNWEPGWYSLSENEPDRFIALVDEATQGSCWTVAGGYTKVRAMLWSRATDLVWLDLPRMLIMQQVIGRSLSRAISGKDVFPGCKEDWSRMLTKEHPIRWAWDTYRDRRRRFGAMITDPAFAHLRVHRARSRRDVSRMLNQLIGEIRTLSP